VVVPDRLQAAAFRRRLAAAGGVLGVQVGTFGDLYRSILEHAGNYIPVAPSPFSHRLLQEIIDRAVQLGDIQHFAPLRLAPGFVLALRDVFAELKRSMIYPDQFLGFAQSGGTLSQKELAFLYDRYQSFLRDLNWADQDGLSWLAVETLKKQTGAVPTTRLLIVDGFDSFTGAQRQALKILADQAESLLITYPGEEASTRSVHRRFNQGLETLHRELTPQILAIPASPKLPADLLYIERALFEPVAGNKRASAVPLLLEARSPAEEAREALRWIKAHVIRDHLSLADCAIFVPNLDVYRPVLRLAATEFGVPIHFTQSETLGASPAIASLQNLLHLPAQNFKIRPLFNALRSPYFDFGIGPQEIDQLESVSHMACIVEGRDQWEETWRQLSPTTQEMDADLDEERAAPGAPHGAAAQALQTSLDGFFQRVSPPEQVQSHTQWVDWLETLLEMIHFYEQASQDRDQLACEAFREALRALVLSEIVIGVRQVDYVQFLSDLQGTLDGVGWSEPRISGQPALLVGKMVEARGIRFQAVALLGLSEGSFPEVERADPFLDETLRQGLGLELRLQREQASLFYQAVTRADRHLLITRPYLSEAGEDWEPSPFWKAVQNLFDDSAVVRFRPDDPRPLFEAASSQELLFWAVRRKALPKRYAELQPRWEALRRSREIVRARRAREAVSPYEGKTDSIADVLTDRYSSTQVWSASRLEAYGTCPHMFYVKVALGLEPIRTPELGLDASQVGSLFHKILERVYQSAPDPTNVDEVLQALPAVARQIFATAPQDYGFRPSPLWEVEQAQFLAILEGTIQALAAETGWTPFAYEQTFGLHGNPPLQVDLGEERLLMHGVIDRLDRNERGEIRVVDYKTGSSHLGPNDLKDGRRLQLPLYALAARDALHLGNPVDGIYWKIKDAEAGSLKLAKFKSDGGQGVEAAIQIAQAHLRRIMAGIRAADFPPVPPKGGCPSYCPAAQWCWRFEPGW
jgi:ATP-dependent helicase/DNAse subunit B